MSCCENATPTHTQPTKHEFLSTKLKNFRSFVEPYCAHKPELRNLLTQFQSLDDVMPFLLQLVALHKAGNGDAVAEQFCAPFGEAADEAFRSRVRRYLSMFVEVLTT